MTGADHGAGVAALARLRRFGGERLLCDMAQIFLADMPGRVTRAREAAAAGDAAGLAYAAHTMKSSSAQFGATALERLCADAERAARAGDLAAAPTLVAGIEREFAQYRVWLEGELPGLSLQSERE